MSKSHTPSLAHEFTAEGLFYICFHLFGVVALFWIAAVLPLWMSAVGLILEVLQMKYFGNCFITVMTHNRGYMKGMVFWEYIPYLLGVKDYKKAKSIIDTTIKIALLVILGYRLVLMFV